MTYDKSDPPPWHIAPDFKARRVRRVDENGNGGLNPHKNDSSLTADEVNKIISENKELKAKLDAYEQDANKLQVKTLLTSILESEECENDLIDGITDAFTNALFTEYEVRNKPNIDTNK